MRVANKTVVNFFCLGGGTPHLNASGIVLFIVVSYQMQKAYLEMITESFDILHA